MKTWEECIVFHGHECPGLAIGYRACVEAVRLLDITFSEDEQMVCVTENDACGVDAIQCALGCSVGKGNLLFKLRGKQAFSFYNRKNGKSVRLILAPMPHCSDDMSREERQEYILNAPEVFAVKEATIQVPERARIFQNQNCSVCGESTMEQMLRIEQGKPVCLDCVVEYSRIF